MEMMTVAVITSMKPIPGYVVFNFNALTERFVKKVLDYLRWPVQLFFQFFLL